MHTSMFRHTHIIIKTDHNQSDTNNGSNFTDEQYYALLTYLDQSLRLLIDKSKLSAA